MWCSEQVYSPLKVIWVGLDQRDGKVVAKLEGWGARGRGGRLPD